MQNSVFGVWQNISGSGMLAALYICVLVFLLFKEKEKYKRILFVYLPFFWLILLFLPITYRIIAEVIDEELYYRFFWMMPMTLVISYGFVQVYQLYRGKFRKLIAVGLVAVIVLCGDFVYNNWRYSLAKNPYHVPQSVVELCDLMHAEGREVMAVFPQELMQYVRQYDSTICMPYGRNVLVSDWKIDHPLNEIMEAEILDGKLLGETASMGAHGCGYIVVRENQKTIGDITLDLAEYGYEKKAQLQGYCVYYNDEIFWSIYK